MPDKNELSIDRITTLAIQDIVNSIREKIGRQLSDDESSFVEAIVGKEHFWARAEELLMLVRSKPPAEVLDVITKSGIWFRAQVNSALEIHKQSIDDPKANPKRNCDMCMGTGICYCIRKGNGSSSGCPRCSSSGQCRHCHGTGGE